MDGFERRSVHRGKVIPLDARRSHGAGQPALSTVQAAHQDPLGMLPSITIVVPTYREIDNLPQLIERVASFRRTSGFRTNLIVVDDDSGDGTAEFIAGRPEPWVEIVVRMGRRGLSDAVLEGLRVASGDVLVCMDADLSHSPKAIPQMIAKLKEGADFVLGSRYVEGGSTARNWGFVRWLKSRVAIALTRPITSVRDPLAGFFALKRSTFESGRDFNPVGYKVGLELMLKCGCERIVEVPIHFENRRHGKGKLTLKEQFLFLRHLRRLYIFKYGVWSQLTQFLLVGGLGTIVNLSLLTVLIAASIPASAAVALAILVSMCFNFLLNRRFSFPHARSGSWRRQFLAFVAAMSVGSLFNYGVTLWVMSHVPGVRPQAAALAGIVVGTVSNFVASRYLVFRMTHVRPA